MFKITNDKITITLFLILVLLFLISLPGVSFAQKSGDTFNWRMQAIEAPSSTGPVAALRGFCERIKEMSNGRINIELFLAGEILPTLEILDGLASGMIDIAYTCPQYYTGAVPVASLDPAGLPPCLLSSPDETAQITRYAGLDDLFREGFAKEGAYYVGTIIAGNVPMTFWSKKPMYGVDDLKGFKIRAFGYFSNVFADLGASAVFLPHEEVYLALAQGTIDGSFTSASHYTIYNYYEVAPYFYLPGLAPHGGGCIMVSQKSWNVLPDDLKAIVKEAFIHFNDDFGQRVWWEYQNSLKNFDKMGVTVITWPEEEINKIRKLSVPYLDEIAKKDDLCARGVELIKSYIEVE